MPGAHRGTVLAPSTRCQLVVAVGPMLRQASRVRLGARPSLRRCYATTPAVAEDEPSLVLDARRQGLLRRTFLDYMPHSAFEANPLVLERAKGLYYWDVTGKVCADCRAAGCACCCSCCGGYPLGLHELNLSDYVCPALLRRNRWNLHGQPRAWSPSGGGCRKAADRPDDVRAADARHRRRDVRLHREAERSNTSRDGLCQNVLWRVGSDGICDQIFAAVLEAVWPSGQVQVHFSLPVVPWVRNQSSLALRSRSLSEQT